MNNPAPKEDLLKSEIANAVSMMLRGQIASIKNYENPKVTAEKEIVPS